MSTRAALALAMAAVLLHAWAILQWRTTPLTMGGELGKPLSGGEGDSYRIPDKGMRDAASDGEAPIYYEEFVSPTLSSGIVHAASLCELPDGRLAASWYEGSKEAAPDVVIRFSLRDQEHAAAWSLPRVIADPLTTSREQARYVRKVGNGLLFLDSADRLCLLFVTMPVGGWSVCSLNIKTSQDSGLTWSRAQRLALSPFFNISELVRNGPIPLAGGARIIPIYHECLSLYSEWLILDRKPKTEELVWRKERIRGSKGLLQPTLAVYGPRQAAAFFRSSLPDRAIYASTTQDGGFTWSKPHPTGLPNPNSAVSALALASGKTLLAFNDSTNGRENMRLAISRDQGSSWKRIGSTDEEPGSEFSYPFLIQDHGGFIRLAYTWKRKSVKLVSFNEAWIAHREKEEEAGSRQGKIPPCAGNTRRMCSMERLPSSVGPSSPHAPSQAEESFPCFPSLKAQVFPFLLVTALLQAILHAAGRHLMGKAFPANLSPGSPLPTLAAVILSCFLCFIPLGRMSAMAWIGGFNSVYSIPSFALLVGRIWKCATGWGLFSLGELRTCRIYGVISGLSLYVPFLVMDGFDPYASGYGSEWLSLFLLGTTLLLLAFKNRFAAVLVIVIAAFDVGLMESNNLWDYITDPVFTILSAAALPLSLFSLHRACNTTRSTHRPLE